MLAGDKKRRIGPSTASEWIDSERLPVIAAHIGHRLSLSPNDFPDLLQEMRIALWKAGMEQSVNATWVFHMGDHKAVDIRRKIGRAETADGKQQTAKSQADPEVLHLLRARAAVLPDRLRDFYQLRYEQGLSERDIARRLGVSRGSIRWSDRQCQKAIAGELKHMKESVEH